MRSGFGSPGAGNWNISNAGCVNGRTEEGPRSFGRGGRASGFCAAPGEATVAGVTSTVGSPGIAKEILRFSDFGMSADPG